MKIKNITWTIAFGFLTLMVILGIFFPTELNAPEHPETLVGADIAWMVVASALVLLMTPGLSFFYGGMVNTKNVISTMFQSFITLGLVSLVWVLCGFSIAFGDSIGGIIGNPFTFWGFHNVGLDANPTFSTTIPFLLFAMFQLKFAIITPALITGSFAERVRLQYSFIAHWRIGHGIRRVFYISGACLILQVERLYT
jgi:ammonium transporter, Amt family